MPNDNKVIDFPNATIIEGDDEMRAKKCLAVINNTLKLYRCTFLPEITFSGPDVRWGVKVIAIPDKKPADGKADN